MYAPVLVPSVVFLDALVAFLVEMVATNEGRIFLGSLKLTTDSTQSVLGLVAKDLVN